LINEVFRILWKGTDMKAKWVKAAGLLAAGSLVFSAAYIDGKPGVKDTQEVMAESTDSQIHEVSAGVSSTLAEQMENYTKQGTDLASGVTDVMSDYLSVTAADMVSVSESDRDMTASGQEDETQTEEEKQAQALAEAASAFGYTNLGIAQADGNINVREVPGTEAEIVGKLPNNAGCEIIGTDGDWTQIESGKVKGYVKSEYLLTGEAAIAKAQEVKQTVATVTTTTLYVRDETNTDSHVITMMPEGEELEVLEVLDGWVKINVDSDEGYVSSDYVSIATELPKAQTMTEVRYGQGVSDVRVSLVSYATQFVGNPYVWGGTSLTRGAYLPTMAFHFHILQEHRQTVVQRFPHRMHSREIFSSTATEAVSIMWLFILEAAVWYMQVHRSPVSRSQEHTIEHRSK